MSGLIHGGTVTTVEDALAAIADAAPVLAEEAVLADRNATVPQRSIELLAEAGLWSAAVPVRYGGQGFGVEAMAVLAARLATSCSATAMIWAMHQLQVACLARCAEQAALADYLSEAARDQRLIASITSEAGIGGNLRTSDAALEPDPSGFRVTKQATTISYACVADAFLLTARRNPQAPPSDQVLVLIRAEQAELTQTGAWNTLGMRGTCSPGFAVQAQVPREQVLDEPFGTIASGCMVPLSHALWSAVWAGIAADALRRASRYSRVKARAAIGAGGSYSDARLGSAFGKLRLLQGAVRDFARDYAAWDGQDSGATGIAIRANALKTGASVQASAIVEAALEICGMAGYSEDGPYSVARHIRDLYSARLMIANASIDRANSELLLSSERVFDL